MNAIRLIVAGTAVLLASCSAQELYATGQGWQQQECRKLQDLAERQRCEKSTAMSYDKYRSEAEAAKKPKSP